MIFISTGWGILGVLIPALFAFVGYTLYHGKGAAIGIVLSAIPIWFIGRRLNSTTSAPRVLVDEQSGQRFTIAPPRHTMFFIDLQWWAIAALVLGVFLYVRF